jgi:hypothetical protein
MLTGFEAVGVLLDLVGDQFELLHRHVLEP